MVVATGAPSEVEELEAQLEAAYNELAACQGFREALEMIMAQDGKDAVQIASAALQ